MKMPTMRRAVDVAPRERGEKVENGVDALITQRRKLLRAHPFETLHPDRRELAETSAGLECVGGLRTHSRRA